MYRQIPNQLTIGRLVLAAVFFVVLNLYRFPDGSTWAVPMSILLFLIAVATDALDGYLARKWKVESTFGRIMDPFCDKVLILGAFIYLSGPRFVDPTHLEGPGFMNVIKGNMVTGVYPWMVAVMLGRELLVTGVRDELEGQGMRFGSNLWGKLKMILQSAAIPIVLFIVWLDPRREGYTWLATARDILVYVTVIATVLSGWPYIGSALRVLGGGEKK